MLVLSRRLNEKIVFPAFRTAVQVLAVRPGTVRLGIEAPPEVTVLRQELQDRAAERDRDGGGPREGAGPAAPPALRRFLRSRLDVFAAGLAALRGQVETGRTREAGETLARVEEDLQLLLRRLDGGPGAARPAKAPHPSKALLVEDNANERELLAVFLRRAGLEVDTAGDGADALDYLRARGRPDVLLLDMGLPRLDGPSAVRAIRRDPALAGLKIYAVTGHTPDEFDLATGPNGVDAWFHKPVDPAALVGQLSQELGVRLNGP